MLKGMTLSEYSKLVEHVQKHHPFIRTDLNGKCVKYIDCIYDTRTQSVWSVSFRGLGVNLQFRTNSFMSHNPPPIDFRYETLLDWIMDYLNDKWKPTQKMEKEMYYA